jgi:cellulose synthase/poly-beta-1,6-N-acetylglucosamine synthase-like glycosyltransferase
VNPPRATIPGEPLDLTFVVCAYNEEECLRAAVEDCLTWMRHAKRVPQILIMNDGSTDRTAIIADELAREHPGVIRAYHAPKNLGQLRLIRTSWPLVATTYYAVIPGDAQFDMQSFDLFLPFIGKFDVILGFPNNEEIRGRLRVTLSYLWRLYLLGLYGIAMVYLGGLIVLPVDLVRRIETNSEGFLGWYELILRVCMSGASIIQIPFVMRERAGGESKAFSPLKNLGYVAQMTGIWRKIKGEGLLPAGSDFKTMKQVYIDYCAANPSAAARASVLKSIPPPAPGTVAPIDTRTKRA